MILELLAVLVIGGNSQNFYWNWYVHDVCTYVLYFKLYLSYSGDLINPLEFSQKNPHNSVSVNNLVPKQVKVVFYQLVLYLNLRVIKFFIWPFLAPKGKKKSKSRLASRRFSQKTNGQIWFVCREE